MLSNHTYIYSNIVHIQTDIVLTGPIYALKFSADIKTPNLKVILAEQLM